MGRTARNRVDIGKMESDSGEMVFEITSEYQEKEESSNLENNNNETKKRNDRRRNKKERVQKDKKSNLGKARRKNSRDEINLEEVARNSTDDLSKQVDIKSKMKTPSIDEIRSYELNRIRLAEGLVNLKSNPASNRKSKKDKKKAHSLTMKNFTTPEEIVLEYLTAFSFPTKRMPLDSAKESEVQYEKSLQTIKKYQLLQEHIVPSGSGFYSRISGKYLPSLNAALHHSKSRIHKKQIKLFNDMKALESLKSTLPISEERKNKLSEEIKNLNLSSESDRIQKFEELKIYLSTKLEELDFELYGSTLTGTWRPHSDINVQVYSASKRPNQVLKDLFERVQEKFYPLNNSQGFTPSVCVVYSGFEFTFVASDTKNSHRLKSGRLIKKYLEFEPKILQVTKVIRQWAEWCRLDRADEGTLPPYAFVIMTIYFFQQMKWIPIFHQMTEVRDKLDSIYKVDNQWKYRPRKSTDFSTTTTTEEISKEEDTFEGDSEDKSSEDLPSLDDADDEEEYDEIGDEEVDFNTNVPEKDISLIVIDFFNFYAFQFNIESKVISLRFANQISRKRKGWGSKRIAVEDPFMQKRNICRTLSSQMTFDYFTTRLIATLMRFFIGPDEFRKILASVDQVDTEEETLTEKLSQVTLKHDVTVTSQVSDVITSQEKRVPKLNKKSFLFGEINSILESRKPTAEDKEQIEKEFGIPFEEKNDLEDDNHEEQPSMESVESIPPEKINELTDQLETVWNEINISGGLRPEKVCQICKNQGCSIKNCPDDISKASFMSLPTLTSKQIEQMNSVLRTVYRSHCPTKSELAHRESALKNLESYLKSNFDSKIKLVLFGSSRNGFGFKGSDMDLCLLFEDNPTEPPEKYNNPIKVIQKLAEILKNCRDDSKFFIKSVIPITQAKVPIVKFEYVFNKVEYEGDISYYNILAQRNTKLLHFYSNLDERCKILGYVLKAMAKECSIADASRGSISSYGYILLLIHYLQRVKVLPCLQELSEDDEKPSFTVEKFETWFQDDPKVISKLFDKSETADSKSGFSLAELWVGMFKYYTEDFKFDKDLIQIRQFKPMTTFEKEWTSKCISIEDPFELSHNLGSGISRKMAVFIIKIFLRGRNLFGTFNTEMWSEKGWEFNNQNLSKAYFSASLLTDGEEVPNDRCCRVCGKIGHFVKDCPSSRKNLKKLARDPDHINQMNSAKCFVCQEPGHFAKNCPEKFNRKSKNEKNEKNSNPPRDEKNYEKPLLVVQDGRKRYQNRKAERNRKKVENGDIGEKDSKDSNESYYKNKNNRGYNRGRYNKGGENEKEREHFEKLTQNFMRGGKSRREIAVDRHNENEGREIIFRNERG